MFFLSWDILNWCFYLISSHLGLYFSTLMIEKQVGNKSIYRAEKNSIKLHQVPNLLRCGQKRSREENASFTKSIKLATWILWVPTDLQLEILLAWCYSIVNKNIFCTDEKISIPPSPVTSSLHHPAFSLCPSASLLTLLFDLIYPSLPGVYIRTQRNAFGK